MRARIALAMVAFAATSLGGLTLAQARSTPRLEINAVTSSPSTECRTDEGYGRFSNCNGGGGGQ